MNNIKFMSYCKIVIFILFFIDSMVFSAPLNEKRFDIGICAGPWFEGDVTFDNSAPGEIKVTKNTNFLLKGFADIYAASAIAFGVYGHYAPSISYKDSNYKQSMYEFGFSIKPRFIVSDSFAIKPGLGVGYRRYSSSDALANNYKALGLNFGVEFQFALTDSMLVFVEPGFLGQPKGGNGDWNMTFPPIWYLMAGIAF